MAKSRMNEAALNITRTRKLGYVCEFRQRLRRYPNVLKTVFKLLTQAAEAYDPADIQVGSITVRWNNSTQSWQEVAINGKPIRPRPLGFGRGVFLKPGETYRDRNGDVSVTMLGKSNRKLQSMSGYWARLDKSNYIKVTLAHDQSFFVKQTWVSTNPGFTEFQSTCLAKQALASLGFVKVVEPQLGYQDRNQSWYVSEWQDLETIGFSSYDALTVTGVNEYGVGIERIEENPVAKQVEQIEATMAAAGLEIVDLAANLFYNQSSGEFILLDVLAQDRDSIGDPIRREDG